MKMSDTYVDAVVVGGGFAGLRALYSVRKLGMSVVVLEAGNGIGGAWYWNRYPGARCDVESYDYSFGFSEELEQEWRWSERYATQPEVLRYIDHVADRFDLRRDVQCNQRVSEARWDQASSCWHVQTESGARWIARYLIMAVGNLSTVKGVGLPGEDQFAGRTFHTARWPHEAVDFTGRRVGVIGTGSSGMQLIPVVAKLAEHVTVFQRTANFSVPARNAVITDEQDAQVKSRYRQRRAAAQSSPSGLGFVPNKQSALEVTPGQRQAHYEEYWGKHGFGFVLAYYDLLLDQQANDTAADFIRAKIADVVKDPQVREALTPREFPFAAKRPSVDSDYFETFNRDNVLLVDVSENPLTEITPTGIATAAAHYDLDDLVFATGFDAITGSLLRPLIVGRDGVTLRDKWSGGPTTYLGLGVHGFPNMFIIAGPGSPSLLTNVLLSIEQHVDWLCGLLTHARAKRSDVIEVAVEAEADWVAHVNEKAAQTLYPKAHSYYMGDEMPGKPRVFMPYTGGFRGYRRILERVEADGYPDFTFSPVADRHEAAG